jgi:hypothetical protein
MFICVTPPIQLYMLNMLIALIIILFMVTNHVLPIVLQSVGEHLC